MQRVGLVRGVTLAGAVALVVGNMVGTSIYTLPASLAAAAGPLGLVAWLLTAAGYLFVALVYADLGTRYPTTGGPYVYARAAFGDFAGFQTVWAYWLSAVIGNGAIVTGVVAYASGLWGFLAAHVWLQFGLALAVLWALTALNVVGVRQSARVQIVVVLLNILPLLVFSVIALLWFDPAHLTPLAPNGLGSLAKGAALVVWGYSGVESATVPAEEVQAPERTIRRGTMLGYGLATCVFLLSQAAVVGALPNDLIAGSARPIGVMVERTAGEWAAVVVGVTAVLAGIGTLNGWILMVGRIPVAAAAEGLFFRRLAAIHPRFGTPHVALITGTLGSSLMLLLYFSKSLLGVFDFIVLLAVLMTLLPHLYAAAAALMLTSARWVAAVAFVFVLYTIYGVGGDVVLWGFLAVLAGTPLYVWFKSRTVHE